MNNYGKFAHIYDDLMTDFNYESWFEYIKSIFKKYDIAPNRILEMACGTGNLSYYLAKEGYDLTCFDLSPDMLAKTYEKLRKYRNVEIINQNMIDFKLKSKYEAVISVCDSINYILKNKELEATFKNVWNHLEDKGVFIFDINSYYKLKNIIGNNTFIHDKEDVFYVWENYFDGAKDICEFYLTFFFKENTSKYKRFDEIHMERAYKVDYVEELLYRVGFTSVDYYKGFTFDDIDDKTERINFVAVK